MIQEFFRFVEESPTAFHAAAAAVRRLEEAGFAPLSEYEEWKLTPGGKYYLTRNLSSVIAFTVPESFDSLRFQIAASHSDSPMLKLKPSCEEVSAKHYLRLNTEKYGGMIFSSWFDRPLGIAGRVMVREGGRIVSRLIDLGRDAAVVPNMPIHFNRDINDGYKYNPQTDMMPLFAAGAETGALREEIEKLAGGGILSADLFLYNRVPGAVWGPKGEFFSSGRIDNLECAFTSLSALIAAKGGKHVNLCAVFDNEEVGSTTKQGADSTLLDDTLARICAALGLSDSARRAAAAASFMVSADNAHAVHPNHPEKFDEDNRAYLNGGVVVKFNANQKYTSDAPSAAVFEEICRRAGVKTQRFANRSDIAGGSTLGNIANAHTSMNTVDIGLGQLAMHSAWETAGTEDLTAAYEAFRAFYDTEVAPAADGVFTLE